MCNTLDTKVIIYNIASADKPAFKEGHQLIANLAVIFFFLSYTLIFSVKRKILFVNNLTGIFKPIKSQWVYTYNRYSK